MLELGHKEGWVPMNWCFQIMVLEKTLESPLDCKEIKPVNPKGNQPRIFVVRTDAEAEAPVFGPPDANSRLIGKDPDIGKDWRQKEKRATEDKMNHWCNGHELGQIPGDGEGQGSLACCSPWGCKELAMTWRLNNGTPAEQKWRHKRWGQAYGHCWSGRKERVGCMQRVTCTHALPLENRRPVGIYCAIQGARTRAR